MGPINDVTYHGGWLWITAEQVGVNGWDVGAISKFKPSAANPASTFTTVITNLPSNGDHGTDQVVFDKQGTAYFSQGTATNSGVEGTDNGLATSSGLSTFHDFAPVPIVLGGSSYTNTATGTIPSETTSPYEPFGVTAPAGTLVPAATPATPQEGIIAGGGTVYSFNPREGSDLDPAPAGLGVPESVRDRLRPLPSEHAVRVQQRDRSARLAAGQQ